MADNQNKSTKTFAVITYAIMLLCLLAGLLLPANFFQGDYNAVVLQIPHALKCVGVDLAGGVELVNPYTITLWGGEAFEIGGLFLLLFALVCVVALVALFVVIFGKKDKNTSLNSSKFIAVISTIVLSVLLSMQMATFSLFGGYELGGSWNIPLLIAFGGAIVILFVQSIYEKGGSGFVKTLLTVFSLLAIVLCVFSFAAIIPQLADALKDALNGNTQILDWTNEGNPYLGSIWFHLSLPFNVNYGDILKELGGVDATLSVFMLLIGVLVIVNFFLDVCGLAKETKRWMIVANLIRYCVELALVLVVLIVGKFVANHEIGLICYALVAFAALPVVINIFRLLAYKTEKKADKKASKKSETAATDAYEPAPYEQPAPVAQPAPQPAPVAAEKAAQPAPAAQSAPAQPAKQQTSAPVAAQTENVYSPVIYSGPRDGFIDTLSNEEKIEFSRVFLEHRNGNIQGVPDYVLDSENDKFFQSLFIYYARVRGLVSDGLMNKFYEKVSALKNN